MSILEETLVVKRLVEKLQREQDKLSGVLEREMEQLEKEFDCNTIEDAQKLLEKMQKSIQKEMEECKEENRAFRDKFKDQLEMLK